MKGSLTNSWGERPLSQKKSLSFFHKVHWPLLALFEAIRRWIGKREREREFLHTPAPNFFSLAKMHFCEIEKEKARQEDKQSKIAPGREKKPLKIDSFSSFCISHFQFRAWLHFKSQLKGGGPQKIGWQAEEPRCGVMDLFKWQSRLSHVTKRRTTAMFKKHRLLPKFSNQVHGRWWRQTWYLTTFKFV